MASAHCLRRVSRAGVVLPEGNVAEALLVRDISLLPARHLPQVIAHLCGKQPIEVYRALRGGRCGASVNAALFS
ncbi:MAG: hypothetical protein ACYYK0_05165 [Candidatus Eutrophobiaceae bacterium]